MKKQWKIIKDAVRLLLSWALSPLSLSDLIKILSVNFETVVYKVLKAACCILTLSATGYSMWMRERRGKICQFQLSPDKDKTTTVYITSAEILS